MHTHIPTDVSSFIQGVGVVRLSGVEICGDEPWHLGLMEGVWWVNPPWLHHGKPTGRSFIFRGKKKP